MILQKNLLVNGCSFSRGPNSWPYFLPNMNLVNLAQAGAGNTYIHETTIAELSQRKYDLVIIMWTGITRIDFKVDDIDLFCESTYTSQYQHNKNDWEEKIIYPINDQDYVEKDWVFGCGHINNESEIKKSKLFTGIYKHVDLTQFAYGLLIKMISLRSVLKQMNIPYLFSFYQDYESELKMHTHLYNLLDHESIYNKENIYNIAKFKNSFDPDQLHPGILAHRVWAELVQQRIEKI